MTSQSDRKHGRWARRIQLAAIVGSAALVPYWAQAAAAEPANTAAAPDSSNDQLEQVVVTATATAVRKLDASYTITSVKIGRAHV